MTPTNAKAELGLAQILPIDDEDEDVESNIISATFADDYVLAIRDDSSVVLFKTENDGDLEEVAKSDSIKSVNWLSGCVHRSSLTNNKTVAFLLSAEGGLHVCPRRQKRREESERTATLIRYGCRFISFPTLKRPTMSPKAFAFCLNTSTRHMRLAEPSTRQR